MGWWYEPENDNNYVQGKTAQQWAWSVRKEGEKKWQEFEESDEFEMALKHLKDLKDGHYELISLLEAQLAAHSIEW